MKRENLTNQGAKDRIATMFCLTSLLQRAERIACKLRWLRNLNDDGCAKDEQLPSVIVNAPAVINGPFAGLIYPENRSVGSRLWPKKLGSYALETRFEVVRENRPCGMQWLFLKSRYNER